MPRELLSTYRVQLRAEFDFDAAAAIADYLAALGGGWWNELTGETLPAGRCRLASLLARFPVALLSRLEAGMRDAGGPDAAAKESPR